MRFSTLSVSPTLSSPGAVPLICLRAELLVVWECTRGDGTLTNQRGQMKIERQFREPIAPWEPAVSCSDLAKKKHKGALIPKEDSIR